MDHILVAGRPHEMKESNKNLRKNVNEKQNEIWPKKKTNCMIVKTSKEKEK